METKKVKECVQDRHDLYSHCYCWLNPFKPEFTIETLIHYKPRIAVAIFVLKPLVVEKLNLFSTMQDDALMHREGITLSILNLP